MKWFVTILILLLFTSCEIEREIQLTNDWITLEKVDTITRVGKQEVLLHWIGDDKVKYTEFDSIESVHLIGEREKYKRRR